MLKPLLNLTAAAARWLGVHYLTYRKYAKIYGLWERHLNPEGVGIKKGYGKYRKPLDQLLSKENRKIRLGLTYLKNRLIDEGWFKKSVALVVTMRLCLERIEFY